MAKKIRKVRISATVPPSQRQYVDRLVADSDMSLAEVLEDIIADAIAYRETQKVNA